MSFRHRDHDHDHTLDKQDTKPTIHFAELHPMYRLLSLPLLLSVLMATSSTDAQAEALAASSGANNNNGELPQLPPPNPNSNLPTFRLGETIRLEEMGPIILNTDGSMRRIENWDTLTEKEKEVSWRRISKRNEERRQKLLQQQQQELLKEQQQQEEKTENEGEEL
jgi:hypothetical protein